MLDALFVAAAIMGTLLIALACFVLWVSVTSRPRSLGQMAEARQLFAFLGPRGFAFHRESYEGEANLGPIEVEFRNASTSILLVRDRSYWFFTLRSLADPSVSFELNQALVALGRDDEAYWVMYSTPKELAAAVEPVVDRLLGLLNPTGIVQIKNRWEESLREGARKREEVRRDVTTSADAQ